jgi:transcriptional regulator GlxA family with amidase domain
MLKIGFLAFPGVQAIDLIAPYELLEVWQNSINESYIKLFIIAKEQSAIECSNSRFLLTPDFTIHNAPQFDYLIIPGGMGRCQAVNDNELISFIQKQRCGIKKFLSVCTGSFVLQAAGILENEYATTYWRALPEFIQKQQKIKEERIVKGNKVWTAGGVSSGIDLALELVNEIAGAEHAELARLCFEYFPLPFSSNKNYNLDKLKPYLGKISKSSDIAKYIVENKLP